MKSLFDVTVTEQQQQVIRGRQLHEFLNIATRYNDWFPRMCAYGFVEGEDYLLLTQKRVTNNPKNPEITYIDHLLKINMAKEVCMLSRSPRGQQARQYFIQVENEWNTPEKIIARALKFADIEIRRIKSKLVEQTTFINQLEKKARIYDEVMSTEETFTVSEIAYAAAMTPPALFKLLRNEGYLVKPHARRHRPTGNEPAGTFKMCHDRYGTRLRVTLKGERAIQALIRQSRR